MDIKNIKNKLIKKIKGNKEAIILFLFWIVLPLVLVFIFNIDVGNSSECQHSGIGTYCY